MKTTATATTMKKNRVRVDVTSGKKSTDTSIKYKVYY